MAVSVRATTRPDRFSFSRSSSLAMVMGVLEVGSDDGLADHLALGQRIEGRPPVVQWIFGIDAGAHLALFGELPDGVVVLATLGGELAAVFAGPDPDHREALD